MPAMPAEKNIREALLALKPSPGKFQLFAEDFMRIKGGVAYQHIVPQGRNANGQPTKGYALPPAPSSGRNESALRIELMFRHAGQCDKKQFRRLFVKLVKTNVLAESVKVMSSQTLATLLSDAGIKHGGLAKSDVLQAVRAVVQARADAYASSLPKNPDEVRALQGLCLQTGVQPGLQAPSHTTP